MTEHLTQALEAYCRKRNYVLLVGPYEPIRRFPKFNSTITHYAFVLDPQGDCLYHVNWTGRWWKKFSTARPLNQRRYDPVTGTVTTRRVVPNVGKLILSDKNYHKQAWFLAEELPVGMPPDGLPTKLNEDGEVLYQLNAL